MQRRNFRRDALVEENLVLYLEKVGISERNKEIIRSYVSGKSYKELAEVHGISKERITQIIRDGTLKLYHESEKDCTK